MTRYLFVFLLLVTLPSAAFATASSNGDYKLESAGALTEAGVSTAVRGVLAEKGLKVIDGNGKTHCEIWFRKEIPAVKAEVDGTNFAQLGEGNLIGVIHFPQAASDFRGQSVKAGYYTLRYGIIPVNGAHMGVSPTRDFLLLLAPGDDKEPNAKFKYEELIKLSNAASGANHVSPWSLTPVAAREGLPKLVKTEEEHVILEISLKTSSGAVTLGITLVGRTEG